MKIAILGSGVIGTLYGWAFAKENEVTHIIRPAKQKKLQNKKLKMDIIDERMPEGKQDILSEYELHVVTQADPSLDLIIVPVAEAQLGEALADLTQNAPDAKYLLMASNWAGTAEIDSYLNKDQYILGYAGGGGTLRNADGQSELWGNIGADVTLGTVYPEQKELLQKVDALFRQTKIIPEMVHNFEQIYKTGTKLGVAMPNMEQLHQLLSSC